MPNWKDVLNEITSENSQIDSVRRKYLKRMHDTTERNIIAYYSGWLQKPGVEQSGITDDDKNGFMVAIHQLDRSKGLDLILHTPGGSITATESIVDYLHKMFCKDIRAFIPQLAMSAGTMIACACKEICMGKQSNIGPIDPQFRGISAEGVIEEFETAVDSVKSDPGSIPIWQTIISHYHPTFLGDCKKAIDMSKDLVSNWLRKAMFFDEPDANRIIESIIRNLSSHSDTKMHDRHIPAEDGKRFGLKITDLETLPNDLQDIVLTIHHAYMHTFSATAAMKIVENHNGVAFINSVRNR